jgi:N-acetylgalactosamine kinase
MAKKHSLDWRNAKKLVHVQRALNATIHDMILKTEEIFSDDAYTKEEICRLLEVTSDELANTSLSSNTLNVERFELKKRALHVFTEAQRVHDFKDICMLEYEENKLSRLGVLMNQSHESCKNLYDCSCSELDKLTDICREAGAYGSRLTGAGWGGCAVSLIPESILDDFMQKIKTKYYSASDDLAEKFSSAAFTTSPAGGIRLFKTDA